MHQLSLLNQVPVNQLSLFKIELKGMSGNNLPAMTVEPTIQAIESCAPVCNNLFLFIFASSMPENTCTNE
jgi:hypothetical protein